MRVSLFGNDIERIRPDVIRAGFPIVDSNPDIVISYGGDGTFLKAEHQFPQVPKVLVRNSNTCRLCTNLPIDEVLKNLRWKDYSVFEITKLKVSAKGKELHGLNDIVVHNENPRHAIRFDFTIGNRKENNIIGDGVVVATTFGSTGYYQSVTHEPFSTGVGTAFNNTQRYIKPIVVPEEEFHAVLSLERGPAVVYVDNLEESIQLEMGDTVEFSCSDQQAKVLILDEYPKP